MVISQSVLGHYLFVVHDYAGVIRQYQLVQEALDRVRLLVVPAPGFEEGRQKRLQEDLSGLLGSDVSVVVERVTAIPCEGSGKRPVIRPLRAVK
jgi:hypothetical protein